jgi:hypothetical protein
MVTLSLPENQASQFAWVLDVGVGVDEQIGAVLIELDSPQVGHVMLYSRPSKPLAWRAASARGDVEALEQLDAECEIAGGGAVH